MNKFLLTLISGISVFTLNAQNVNIPDANFKAYLVGNTSINTNLDTEIQVTEASSYTGQIVCPGMNIADLTGIEAFTQVQVLDCYFNQLTSLDLSSNTAMAHVQAQNNQITSINVSTCTQLLTLICSANLLTTIDVSNNISLSDFRCHTNQLTGLNLTNNTALQFLYANDNLMTSINLSSNTLLNELRLHNNPLTSIDLSTNINLVNLQILNTQITSIDLSNNIALTHLLINNNQISSLDLSNNPALYYLQCNNCILTSLDLSANTSILYVYANANQITDIDLSNHPNLYHLDCQDNNLSSLKIDNGNNAAMAYFWAINNPNLECIQVDNAATSTTNWSSFIDATAVFSEDCATVGIKEEIENTISIYPNPAQNTVTVQTNNKISGIEIYSIEGKLVQTETNSTFSVANLPNGIYILKVKTASGITVSRLVKE